MLTLACQIHVEIPQMENSVLNEAWLSTKHLQPGLVQADL